MGAEEKVGIQVAGPPAVVGKGVMGLGIRSESLHRGWWELTRLKGYVS